MNIAQKYVDGLKKAYYANDREKQWNNFEEVMHGASKEDFILWKSYYRTTSRLWGKF